MTMKLKKLFCLCLLFGTIWLQAQDFSGSVVSITKGNSIIGTGFFFESNAKVVTTLHVLADPSRRAGVTIKWNGRSFPIAGPDKVIKEADLVVLNLTQPVSGAKPIPLSSVQVQAGNYQKYTFDGSGTRIERNTIKITSGKTSLNSLLSSTSSGGAKQALQQQGYPSVNSSIIRVSNVVRKSDSGAPVCDQHGLVGVIDGGLHFGRSVAAGHNWAIHAQSYLASHFLAQVQTNSFAGLSRPVNGVFLVTDDIENTNPIQIEGLELEYLRTEILGDVIKRTEGMGVGNQEYYNDAFKSSNKRVLNAKIDFYLEEYTNSIFALPHNASVYENEKFVDEETIEELTYVGIRPQDASQQLRVELIFVINTDFPSGTRPGDQLLEFAKEDFPIVSENKPTSFNSGQYLFKENYELVNNDGGTSYLEYYYYIDHEDENEDHHINDFFAVQYNEHVDYDKLTPIEKYYSDLFFDCSMLSELMDDDEDY